MAGEKETGLTVWCGHGHGAKTWTYKTKDTNPYPHIYTCQNKKNIPENIHIHLHTKKGIYRRSERQTHNTFTQHNTTQHTTHTKEKDERERERERERQRLSERESKRERERE